MDNNDRQIKKLEEQMKKLDEEISLEEKEKDIIKDYKMKEGDYQIIIKVYEANDLQPPESRLWFFKKSACEAFVEISIRDQTSKTQVRKETNNPIFDERFCFKFQQMTLHELQRSTITFKVYDKKTFIGNGSVIGSFELDWTNVYFKRNHQIYRGWLTLMDPFDETEGITGYLLVDIAILGENDKVTVHDSAFIKDPMTTIEDTVTMPKLQLIDFAISVDIYRAENLIPLDQTTGNVDAYVIAKFSGNKISTSVKHSCNPQWDEQLLIGTGIPTKSKNIYLQVRNRNFLADDIIGIIKIPFIDLKEEATPKWGHLYGPPMSGKDIDPYNYATKMQLNGQQIGSHYRGRILYSITGKKDSLVKNTKKKLNFKFPFKPTPVVPLKTYTLRIDLLNGFDLPEVKERCYIHAAIGQYTLCSQTFHRPENRCIEFANRLDEKKIHLPQDPTQIPDLIIYYSNGKKQKNRVSYVRIKAEQLFASNNTSKNLKIYTLTGDLSLDNIKVDQNGGYLTMRAFIFSGLPPQSYKMKDELGQKYRYVLKSFIYRGRGFPPMNERGDCDAFVDLKCEGSSIQTEAVSSYNPIWDVSKQFEIQTYNIFDVNLEIGVICTVYDKEDRDDPKMIGNFMLKLSKKGSKRFQGKNPSQKINFIYNKPKWYPVINNKINVRDPCMGHVLYGCALFRKEDIYKINQKRLEMVKGRFDRKIMQIYLIGIRQMQFEGEYLSNQKIQIKLSIDQNEDCLKESKKISVREGCVHFNQMLSFEVHVPRNRCLAPYLDIKLFRNQKQIFGYSSMNIFEVLPKLKETQEQKKQNQQLKEEELSEETILDVETLEKQLEFIREQKRIKEARQRAERDKQAEIKTPLTELIPPLELGAAQGSTADTEKDRELDQLLKNSLNEFSINSGPNHNFARQSQLRMDRQSQMNKSPNMQDFLNIPNQTLRRVQKKQRELLSRKNKESQVQAQIIHISEQQSENEEHQYSNKQIFMPPFNNQQESKDQDLQMEQQGEKMHLLQKIPMNEMNIDEEEQRYIKHVKYNNSEQFIKDTVENLERRFSIRDEGELRKKTQNWEEDTIKDFQIKENENISQIEHDARMITYKDVERIIQQEEDDTKQAKERMENYKFAAAVKLSLFEYKKKKKNYDQETYLDYNTDEEENLDIIPEWYKGRKILSSDFEDLIEQKKKIRCLPLYRGGQRIPSLDIRRKEKIAHLRFVAISTEVSQEKIRAQYYEKLLKIKSFVCRIYILKGKSLISNFRGKPTTYLRITFRGTVYDLKDRTRQVEDYDPEYYTYQQLPMEIPGPSTVKIEVMQEHGIGGIMKPKTLGYTLIDIQQRYFMKKWHLFAHKKPIELRNLYSEYGIGTQGRLQVWVDLIDKKDWLRNPPIKIHPPPYESFELRVIVWSTKDCVYKNQSLQSNDVFVRGFLGVSQPQETDTHWACRGIGNFNYRFKFNAKYPPRPEQMYSDQFIVQIWDRDMVGYNNLIGEKRINLNKIHRIIEKAVKRKKAVKAKMKIREKSLALTDKFWFDVYNHKVKDQFGQLESQGKVQMSFELVPTNSADEQLKNGYGRSEPNVFPTLQEPAGRLNFNLFHPLDFFKQLCGPELYNSLCTKLLCFFILIIIGVLLYFIIGQLIAGAIIGGGDTTINNNNINSTNTR